ncbi:DNA sulfur modification protein DndB [Geodermatophilus normandii]|uniref:DNA sulfur modification protein DndB n=1 Tax=Geodermatophilus normandii TaxID=1137989 RepID=A0A317QKH0_9ACTN|nr:DNA sulfur modification protein DndB [Geodermatophilus normandii]PWW23473.1 DNA sulfur modification protein DndB [Geodermatophilus normandii]
MAGSSDTLAQGADRGSAPSLVAKEMNPEVAERGESGYEYVLPAIRGVQAGTTFFVTMIPLRVIAKLFVFDGDELAPELRAQRSLNKGRLPEMVRYMVENPTSYTFSALTASIDGTVRFDAVGDGPQTSLLGNLRIPMESRFVINDGQHRHAAIKEALQQLPSLGQEMIAVVFYLDVGLQRCQQMFADLNRHAVRPSKSIGVLYDHRDSHASLSRLLVLRCPAFRGFVEMESSSLAKASRKLFTLSAIHGATRTLLEGLGDMEQEQAFSLADQWWRAVDEQLPEWQGVRNREMRSPEVRADFIHTHGITLAALARVGNTMLRENRDVEAWQSTLASLRTLDWSRQNPLWEGRALVGGRVVKGQTNVLLTTAAIRQHLGMDLPPDERRAEAALASANTKTKSDTAVRSDR